MKLQITITLSKNLFKLLEDKLPNLGRRVECALTKELGRELRDNSEISVKPITVKKPAGNAAKKTKKNKVSHEQICTGTADSGEAE